MAFSEPAGFKGPINGERLAGRAGAWIDRHPDSRRIPDSPAGFLESWRGYVRAHSIYMRFSRLCLECGEGGNAFAHTVPTHSFRKIFEI
jgi:hypothetical protein